MAKSKKYAFASAKRKKARARAVVKKGTGVIRFNGSDVSALQNKYLRAILLEPLSLIGTLANKIDVSVKVVGGGIAGQVQAGRGAIAKAIVKFTEDEKIKEAFENLDRALLVDDVRQVEPKKYRRKGARARYQKSYR